MNYKFIGEIERGRQNASFDILVKITTALEADLPELFRFEQEGLSRKQVETEIRRIVISLSDKDLTQLFSVLRVLFPVR